MVISSNSTAARSLTRSRGVSKSHTRSPNDLADAVNTFLISAAAAIDQRALMQCDVWRALNRLGRGEAIIELMHTFEFSHSCSSSSSTQITFGMFAAAKHTGTGLCTISARIYVMECVLYDMLQWSAHCTCNDAQNGATAPHACLTLCCCSCNCCRLSGPRVSPRFSSRDRSSDQPITSRTSRIMRSRKKTRRTRTQPCGDVPSNNPFVDVCSAIGTLTLRIGMLRKREGVKTTSSETCF